MRVNKLEINNFRCFDKLDMSFHEKMNIFVGVNGAGKSSVLDCLAVLLSRLIGRIRSTRGTGRFFKEEDIKIGKKETKNLIVIYPDLPEKPNSVTWSVIKSRRKTNGQTISNLKELRDISKQFHIEMEKSEDYSIPVCIFYPVNRAVLDIPLRIRKQHAFQQLAAYDQALSGGRNDFRILFEWYRNREDLENEKRVREQKYRDPQLQAVREAIQSFLPGFSDLRVRRSPLRMTVRKGAQELIVNQLSDGEKCLLALVGDLARRLAIANPSRTRPINGKGVVLIDEIDLHLHPSWQREVVPLLLKTFPNCQFFLTTHSAQILSHVHDPHSIFILKYQDETVQLFHPESVYGLDSNRILEDFMDVPERPKEVKASIGKLFDLIDRKELNTAKKELDQLKREIGSDPALTRAKVLIRRLEIIGK